MSVFLIVFIYCTFNAAESVSTSNTGSSCIKINTTVTCNYIPVSVPVGTVSVLLRLQLTNHTFVNSSTFISSGWDEVTQLEFRVNNDHFILQDNCFNGLNELRILKFHAACRIHLDVGSFEHLDNVRVLDMSDSVRLEPVEFMNAMGGYDKVVKLPQLTTLVLSNTFLYRKGFGLEDGFVKNVLSGKISHLDLSGIQISKMNFTSVFGRLKHLDVFNLSDATLDNCDFHGLTQGDMMYLKSFDISFITFPKKAIYFPPGMYKVTNVIGNLSEIINIEGLKLIMSPVSLNSSGIVPSVTSFWAWNCTVHVDRSPDSLTKTIVARKNNIRRLDLSFICDRFYFSSFEHIDISDNGLEFIHPNFLSCMPNIRKVNLSNNLMFQMAREDISMFENVLSGLKNLQYIYLSRNQLTDIPMAMFKYNELVEEIDLSNNQLKQVRFALTRQKKLRVLNLQGNKIKTLDPLSINNLKGIHRLKNSTEHHVLINLKNNPLDCSKCETKTFLTWLISTPNVDVSSQSLVCSNENGHTEEVTGHVLDKVKEICRRKTIIIATSVSAVAVCIILIISLIIFRLQRKRASEMRKRENVINMLRKGEDQYQFLAFLAFSSEDEEFVNTNLLNQLNENLQLMTGIDRNLVCTGDLNLRPGFYLHNETYLLLNKTCVIIAAVSKNFCHSVNCQNELEQAYVNGKPIILMFIEHVEQEQMSTTMKELYQRKVRIVWTLKNGEYEMKTTWGNVCTSILELIK